MEENLDALVSAYLAAHPDEKDPFVVRQTFMLGQMVASVPDSEKVVAPHGGKIVAASRVDLPIVSVE